MTFEKKRGYDILNEIVGNGANFKLFKLEIRFPVGNENGVMEREMSMVTSCRFLGL